MDLPRTSDVLIAGGGPAGLVTAIALRRAGFRVTVVDPASPPVDKACGEGILPKGMAVLRELGVDLPSESLLPFHGIRFIEDGAVVEARFRHGCGYGVRRTVLHDALARRAAGAGVILVWGARAGGITAQGVMVGGHDHRCRWIIGADGHNSGIRRWSGLAGACPERVRFGFRRHFAVKPWSDLVEVYWNRFCQLYVTPLAGEAVGVALLADNPRLRMVDALEGFPQLRRRLENAAALTREQGGLSVSRHLPQVCRGRVALVGDASGSVDAITGDGLSLAFQQALALRDALCGHALHRYQPAHRRIVRWPRCIAGLLLAMSDWTWFRRRVFNAFGADPQLFPQLLGIETGEVSPVDFGVSGAAALVWNFLAAPERMQS